MLAMTYEVNDDAQLYVHCMFLCDGMHNHTVHIPTAARLEAPAQKAKHWYRYAENVLLSLGKARYATTKLEDKAGVEVTEKRVLACAECKGGNDEAIL